jgi:hypothetical protein
MMGAFFTTPFGRLDLSARAGQKQIGGAPKSLGSLEPDGHILSWLVPEFDAELVIAPLPTQLPPTMTVTASRVAIWRILALADVGPLVFSARWAPDAMVPSGGPDSGQALNALTWGTESIELSLGAPDAEGLIRYEETGVQFPQSWRSLLETDDLTTVHVEDYFADGLSIRLPSLRRGETAHMHFAVAWTDAPTDDAASWFAVDVGADALQFSHRRYLRRINRLSESVLYARWATRETGCQCHGAANPL